MEKRYGRKRSYGSHEGEEEDGGHYDEIEAKAAGEILEAIEKKDEAGLKDALEAFVKACMMKETKGEYD